LAALWLVALILTCLISSGVTGWVWILVLNDDPPWNLIGGAMALVETPLFFWLASRGPPQTMPGESPEAMAADRFFQDRKPPL
jgi:hypothetical protein